MIARSKIVWSADVPDFEDRNKPPASYRSGGLFFACGLFNREIIRHAAERSEHGRSGYETMIGQVKSHRDKVGNLPTLSPKPIFASEPERPFEVYVLQL